MDIKGIYNLPEMTWKEAEEAYKNAKLAIIPVGSNEQHGPGIKLKVDGAQAYEMSKVIAKRVHPLAVVTPPVMMGISHHHMFFPGTVTLRSSTFMAVIEDIVVSMNKFGFTKFLIVDTHGGNRHACNVIAADLKVKMGVEIAHTLYIDVVRDLVADIPKERLGHGSEPGLGVALYLDKDLVYMDRLVKAEENWPYKMIGSPDKHKVDFPWFTHEVTKSGAFGDASEITIEESTELGEKICNEVAKRLEIFIRDFVKEK